MSAEKIIADWERKKFSPVYWLEGEEAYFIDQLVDYAEHRILSEAESSFNLTVFYGKDANWADIINACRRYPVFAEKQVVLLKEAQMMREKELDKLEPYVENPMPSTIFIVSYKDKKLDGRKKFSKLIQEKGVVLTTKKIGENKLQEWIEQLIKQKGYSISPKALALLADHTGNDLARINNELDKLVLNLGKRTAITENDIEDYIGVSKEFNVFELQAALATRNLPKAIRIVQYFEANPKAAPIQMILPLLYSFFSKTFMVLGCNSTDEKKIAAETGINPYFLKENIRAARLYSQQGIEKALLLLHRYNLKSIGIGDAGTEDAALLKELVIKIVN